MGRGLSAVRLYPSLISVQLQGFLYASIAFLCRQALVHFQMSAEFIIQMLPGGTVQSYFRFTPKAYSCACFAEATPVGLSSHFHRAA